jgi:lipoprotein signal peptidase
MNETLIGKRRWHWLLISLAVVIADQLSKAYVLQHLGEFEVRSVFPVLDVTLMHNTGAAFSFLASASGWQRWFFIGLAGVVCIALAFWLCSAARSATSSIESAWGQSLISFISIGSSLIFRHLTSQILPLR